MRVLVLGSPNVPDPRQVRKALRDCAETAAGLDQVLHLTHGGHRTGAEAITHEWASERHAWGLPVAKPVAARPQWTAACDDTCPPDGHRRPVKAQPGVSTCPGAQYRRNETLINGQRFDLYLIWSHEAYRSTEHALKLLAKRGLMHRTVAFRT